MGQRDPSPPTQYIRDVKHHLDDLLAFALPEEVLEQAAGKAFAAGLEPCEAAIHLCDDHSWLLSRQWVEANQMASELAEFSIASRISECANLAREMDQDLLDLLPDLPDLVGQPCFSDGFRDTVAHIATWHGIPEHRWSAPEVQVGVAGRVAV